MFGAALLMLATLAAAVAAAAAVRPSPTLLFKTTARIGQGFGHNGDGEQTQPRI